MHKEESGSEELKKLYELTKENNELLKKLEKYQKINTTLKVIYWVIILISVFGAYFAIQPFIRSLFGENNTTFENISVQTQNLPEVSRFKKIMSEFGN